MPTVSMKQAKDQLPALTRLAESGETVVITRNGKPVAEIVPYKRKQGGINWAAIEEFKQKHGIDKIVSWIADDFDDPLPEDFLIKPLPEP